jgi:hypothetical protein
VTYSNTDVQEQLSSRFVLLKLDLFKSPRTVVRPLNVIWTPTLLFADRRGTVHYRSVNFLPPRAFLTILDIGEAHVDLRWTRMDAAIERLNSAFERDPDGKLADEVLYWLGIATYLKTHSNDDMYRIWHRLQELFPDSIWSTRIPKRVW